MQDDDGLRERYRIDDLVLDVGACRLTRDAREISLPELSFNLLVELTRRAPALVKTDVLMKAVWGDVIVSDETVTQRVKLLRDALRSSGVESQYIATVRGRGYKLSAPVKNLAEGDTPGSSFLGELKQRRVFRVAGLYAVVAWLLTEVAATVFPALRLPDWTVTLVVALLVLGFPVAMVFAWLFDIGPQGIERTDPSHRRSGWLGYGLLLLMSTAVLSTLLYVRRPASVEDRADSPIPRVAVLPFADLSPGGTQIHFSDGFHDELISQLAEMSGIAVSSRTSVMPYRTAEKSLRDIATELDADVIVEGTIRYMDDRVRFTAQLIDANTDEHLWSERYDRELSTENIFAIQEDVATQIAVALEVQVSDGDRTHLARIPTNSLKAYEQHALGRYHLWRWNQADLARAITFFEQALEYDPDFAEANTGLGWAYAFS